MTNQNFRVKKGLEVGLGGTYLYADDTGVGIGSSVPRVNLDVRGEAYIEKLEVGPGAAQTDLIVNGDSYFVGDVFIEGDLEFEDADLTNLNVSGIATINELEFNNGIGTNLGVTGLLTANNLEVSGVSTFNDNILVDGALAITSSVGIAKTLFVGGDVVIGGGITFQGDVNVNIDVNVDVDGNINATGISTFENLNFNVGIGSTLTVDYLNVNEDAQINGAGIATLGGDPEFNTLSVVGFATIGGGNTTGFSTFYQNVRIEENLEVGGDITLLDLDAGNISVAGTVYTNGLEFGVGIGSTLTVGILSVTEELKVDGVGVATIGGDPVFNSLSVTGFSTFGGLNTTGFSTFYQNVRVDGDLAVTGDITLEDLESGNISVGGTIVTNGLEFNTGIGTELVVGLASITDATIGIATVSELNVTGFATFGGLNTTGFSTFYQNLEVTGDLQVGGDINLEDLNADSISIGNTVTTDDLIFNVGIGTSLVITGISSLNIITGIGSELQYLPAGSISTSVGVGSTIPPSIRPTGEPVQPGDLWFDADGKRQYTYFVGLNTLGSYEGQWVDSNPPPVQPLFRFNADTGVTGQVDLQTETFDLQGFSGQIITRNTEAIIGAGRTVNIGLTTDVAIEGSVSAGGSITAVNAFVSGLGSFGSIYAPTGQIDTLSIEGITVDDIVAGDITIQNLEFDSGIGTNLEVDYLNVTGIATINGAGIATLGGDANFDHLTAGSIVAGVTTLGLTTITGDLYVGGDIFVRDDLEFDEATLRNITVSENSYLNNLSFNVGVATELTVQRVAIGDTLSVVNDVEIGGTLDVTGIASFSNKVETGTIESYGNISAINGVITGKFVTATDNLGFGVGSGSTLTISDQLNATGESSLGNVGLQTVVVSQRLEVEPSGIGSFIGELEFNNSTGWQLTVDKLTANEVAFPGGPGGGTGISSDFVDTQNLNVSGLSTFVGLATFQGDVFIADDLEVKRNLIVGGIATIGVITATSAVLDDLTVTGTLSAASGGQLIVEGDTVIDGVVTIGGNSITLDGRQGREYIELGTGSGNRIAGVNTFTGERSYVSVDEGRFNNFISVAGIGSTSTFANDVEIDGKLTVGGDITFDGEVVGFTTITNLNVTGIATVGFITAQNASVAGIITAQDFNSLSDRRVKENIESIVDPLDKVAKLNGVTYQFVNSGKKSVGVIAQEVEKVFPELIAGTFPKSVNYNGLTGLLIEAVKELKEQNEELKRRLDKLEG